MEPLCRGRFLTRAIVTIWRIFGKASFGRAASLGLAFLLNAPALAQDPVSPPVPSLPDLSTRKRDLRSIADQIEASREEKRKLEAEIAALQRDRAKFSAALVETAEAARATEERIFETKARLDTLTGSETAIRKSLESRRGVIAEVLAALQRMGRRPPPAILVAPEDMLQSIRTSMLLGSVLPEMQGEVDALSMDLLDLVRLRERIGSETAKFSMEATALEAERTRLAALIDRRQSALSQAEDALGSEQRRIAELGSKATSLEDLIHRMERDIEAAARGAEAARKAEEARRDRSDAARQKLALAPFSDPARLAPAVAFAQTKGLLPLPVSGRLIKRFGQPDGFGGVEKGMLIGTRAGAFVASPCDGWVSYAGPYRSYGQLLIVNAGHGYYIILAGMDRINVNVGQFILAGEPVASMGDTPTRTAAAIATGAIQPILYVEFRKDGAAIDPGPWWAKPGLQKVGG
jgi:septal ring factor EnvC (AmiA/AmiB activator)